MVASDGIVPGRKVVVLQCGGLQAQRTGRSWIAAQSMVATITQGGSCTYFCRTSRATCCREWYNTGQSSRSMARLLPGDSGKKHQLKSCQKRELLLFQRLPTSLKDVAELGNENVTLGRALPLPSIRRLPSIWVGAHASGADRVP